MGYRSYSKVGVDVLRTQGDLNADEMVRMKDRVSRLLNKNHKHLVLDLASAQHVELVALGLLVERVMKVRAQQGELKLCNIRPEVAKAFEQIGVRNFMESFNSEEEALKSFAA